jgi:hypothetical protein
MQMQHQMDGAARRDATRRDETRRDYETNESRGVGLFSSIGFFFWQILRLEILYLVGGQTDILYGRTSRLLKWSNESIQSKESIIDLTNP